MVSIYDNSHTIPYTFKIDESQEKSEELLETPTIKRRAISSQAIEGNGSMEGSETMRVSPNNNPSQEHPTRKGRYSPSIMDNIMKYGINSHTITKLNSIPFTLKIEALSEFDIQEILKGGLLDDNVKCIEGKVEREFNASLLRYVGSSTTTYALTTNGTATATNTSILNSYHIRKMVLELKKRNVPGFPKLGGDYGCVASLEAMENLQGAMETINSYTESGYKKILAGEVGRIHGCRFVEDAFASRFTYSSSARTATAKSWTGGNSLDAYIFGTPTVMEAIVVPEEIRMKVVTDYGRSKGIGWYWLGGFKIIWDTSGGADSRIIKWDSA